MCPTGMDYSLATGNKIFQLEPSCQHIPATRSTTLATTTTGAATVAGGVADQRLC